MKRHHAVAVLAALLCCFVLVGVVLAQGSANYRLSWSVLGGGGGTFQSSHYVLSGTGSQTATGAAASSQYRLGSGFWYVFGIPAQPRYKTYLPLILSGY